MDATHILDVRSKLEYLMGHKSGAVHFSVERIIHGELPDLPRDAAIAVYCASGARSATAARVLTEHGFTNVTDQGGYRR